MMYQQARLSVPAPSNKAADSLPPEPALLPRFTPAPLASTLSELSDRLGGFHQVSWVKDFVRGHLSQGPVHSDELIDIGIHFRDGSWSGPNHRAASSLLTGYVHRLAMTTSANQHLVETLAQLSRARSSLSAQQASTCIDFLNGVASTPTTPVCPRRRLDSGHSAPAFSDIITQYDSHGGLLGAIQNHTSISRDDLSTLLRVEETGIRTSLRYYALFHLCRMELRHLLRNQILRNGPAALKARAGFHEQLVRLEALNGYDSYPGGIAFNPAG